LPGGAKPTRGIILSDSKPEREMVPEPMVRGSDQQLIVVRCLRSAVADHNHCLAVVQEIH
jgi:hypothetical protein